MTTIFRTGSDYDTDFRGVCAEIIKVDKTEAALINAAINHGEQAKDARTDILIAAANYYIANARHSDLANLMKAWRDRTRQSLDEVYAHVKNAIAQEDSW
jgi:DNA-binding transcriptional regulator YbjK